MQVVHQLLLLRRVRHVGLRLQDVLSVEGQRRHREYIATRRIDARRGIHRVLDTLEQRRVRIVGIIVEHDRDTQSGHAARCADGLLGVLTQLVSGLGVGLADAATGGGAALIRRNIGPVVACRAGNPADRCATVGGFGNGVIGQHWR